MFHLTGVTAFLGAILGFYAGVFWIDTTQNLEITRLNKEIQSTQSRYEKVEKTISDYKATIKGKDNSVANFCKSYGVK